MPTISYSEFQRLAEVRAYGIYDDRTKIWSPRDHLSDWIAAEREVFQEHRIAITLGICSYSAKRYHKVFEDQEFDLRNIPCVFKSVTIDEMREIMERVRRGCHIFLDQHGKVIFADLMAGYPTPSGNSVMTNGIPCAYRSTALIKNHHYLFDWLVEALRDSVAGFDAGGFQRWLKIEPASYIT